MEAYDMSRREENRGEERGRDGGVSYGEEGEGGYFRVRGWMKDGAAGFGVL